MQQTNKTILIKHTFLCQMVVSLILHVEEMLPKDAQLREKILHDLEGFLERLKVSPDFEANQVLEIQESLDYLRELLGKSS